MKGFRWWTSFLVLAVVLSMSLSVAHAGKNIYIYDPSVVGEVDINAFVTNGTVKKPNGQGFTHNIVKGPAPSGYPTIDISEKSFEYLGASNAQIDGVIFLNHANGYVPNKKALVLWTVRIPNASQRAHSEFEKDLTLSMWVDWNRDNAWKPGERVIVKSLNFANEFPTTQNEIVISYLTSFRVPDVMSAEFLSAQGDNNLKETRVMWVRALVAYDDADVSPDGDQLFGEYEDYRVQYMVQNSTAK